MGSTHLNEAEKLCLDGYFLLGTQFFSEHCLSVFIKLNERDVIILDKAWSQHLYKELDITDIKSFPEHLKKDIKKNPKKYRLVCSECKIASIIYARGEKREYFTSYETTSDQYVPHTQMCSYSLPTNIVAGFQTHFSNIQVALVDKTIELDFTSFLNQNMEENENSRSNVENNKTPNKPGVKTRSESSGSTKNKMRRYFSTFSEIVEFFRVNLCSLTNDMDYDVTIKGIKSSPVPLKEAFLDSVRLKHLLTPSQPKVYDRFFYGHIKNMRLINESYRIQVKSNRDTTGFSTFIKKSDFDQYVLDTETIPSEDSLFVCFGNAAITKNGIAEYTNVYIEENCFRFFSNIAKDGHSVRSKFEVDIDNFISGSVKLKEFNHVVPGSLQGYNAQWNVDRCRAEFQPKNNIDLFYIPDFILESPNRNPIIIECFGFDSSIEDQEVSWEPLIRYREKKERKIDFFRSLPDYDFIAVHPSDVMEDNKINWKKAHQFFSDKLERV
ncbi:hypothetical protein [Paenibacillus periandrae]|uniref:hypothetical protein n=1 Tax=Paenibacillus periandrae TaxID=1761741 RepID=UPI001F089492|nr:hypothetical protein [Paenibacillus periandrae]